MKSTRYLVTRLEDLNNPDGFQIWECLSRLGDFNQRGRKRDDFDTKYVVHRGSKLPPRCITNTFPIYKFNGTKLKRTKQSIIILGEG